MGHSHGYSALNTCGSAWQMAGKLTPVLHDLYNIYLGLSTLMPMHYNESQRNTKHAIVMKLGKRYVLYLVVAVHIVQNYTTSGEHLSRKLIMY